MLSPRKQAAPSGAILLFGCASYLTQGKMETMMKRTTLPSVPLGSEQMMCAARDEKGHYLNQVRSLKWPASFLDKCSNECA